MTTKKLALTLIAVLLLAFPAAAQDAEPDLTPPVLGEFDPASVAEIDVHDYPVLPELSDHARAIFERGQELERSTIMFSKVGDSMTASESFLVPFGEGDYSLGEYTDLEPVIQFYLEAGETNAFNRQNYATTEGFTTATVLDSTWADADDCNPNESPLACEYRLANPAIALMMFGTNDVMFFDASMFDYFLRTIVLETIDAGVLPVLYTMPIRPEEPDKSQLFNQIIVKIADDYQLPLINLVVALEHLPEYGVDLNDTLHLTTPPAPGTVATFEGESLEAGYTIRNLVTLQALDHLLTGLGALEATE